jgi:hypothetical protein
MLQQAENRPNKSKLVATTAANRDERFRIEIEATLLWERLGMSNFASGVTLLMEQRR